MIPFTAIIHKNVEKTLKSIPPRHLEQFVRLIDSLEMNPFPWKNFDLTKIEGAENTYRIRFGTYRVVYYVDKEQKTIHVLKFDLRKRVYKK